MIANDKCKTLQDTEIDIIYQVVGVKVKPGEGKYLFYRHTHLCVQI